MRDTQGPEEQQSHKEQRKKAINSPEKVLGDLPERVALKVTTFKFPLSLDKRLARYAFDNETTKTAILRKLIEDFLKRKGY